MIVYRIVFANNEPISCKDVSDEIVLGGAHQYAHTNGKIIYVLVKADSETEAYEKVTQIIKEVRTKFPNTTHNPSPLSDELL